MLIVGWGQVIKLPAWTDPVFSGGGEERDTWTPYCVHAALLMGPDHCLSKLSRCPPRANGCCCAACPGSLQGFWSLREPEAEADRAEGRDKPNESRMESWKKVDAGRLPAPVPQSLLCCIPPAVPLALV